MSKNKSAIVIQKNYKGFKARKNNIYLNFKNSDVKKQFFKVISGYHLINKSPVKESIWEDINCSIVKNFCLVADQANGNHKSGKDNKFNTFNISNKTLLNYGFILI